MLDKVVGALKSGGGVGGRGGLWPFTNSDRYRYISQFQPMLPFPTPWVGFLIFSKVIKSFKWAKSPSTKAKLL